MITLARYHEFVERVEELGFMFFSSLLPGFPSLAGETDEGQWHTGDRETDPWCWKDRAAEEKKLAYGCILGGHKGFVSPQWYPFFHAACHPEDSMEERKRAGLVSQATWQLWNLFDDRMRLSTSDIRRRMGVKSKKNAGRVDRATRELQQYYYITVCGRTHKVNIYGEPYGWAINLFERVSDWVPSEWMKDYASLSREEAREALLERGLSMAGSISRQALAKMLGFRP
ncbi:MAG: hypothetical protein RDV48_31395 [Candidatus Eremiobacteraeota bacterium]|nr:hypothetical protein [Candidatus Eremiobacteraeota bacterium]